MEDQIREFVYEQIRRFRHDVGHHLHVKGIWLTSAQEPPHIQNNWPRMLDQLADEGMLEKAGEDFVLTEKGYSEIYGLT